MEKMAHICLVFKNFFSPKLPYFNDKLAKNIKGWSFTKKTFSRAKFGYIHSWLIDTLIHHKIGKQKNTQQHAPLSSSATTLISKKKFHTNFSPQIATYLYEFCINLLVSE